FMAMTNHYVFEPTFCNPASGWEKGQVEKGAGPQGAAHHSHRPHRVDPSAAVPCTMGTRRGQTEALSATLRPEISSARLTTRWHKWTMPPKSTVSDRAVMRTGS
ncbi:hypothetical protein, partial [Cereibacter sediminicola]|uniref:hypothetical protein n=1 Tax=Cereibacter sediminicola TaxID=2584941 RepID=UPI0011A2A470